MQNSSTSRSERCNLPTYDRVSAPRRCQDREDDLSQSTVKVTMQSTSTLMDVLVTVSRIGAKINFVSAKDVTAILTVSAKPNVARRVPGLLRELVDVVDVCDLG